MLGNTLCCVLCRGAQSENRPSHIRKNHFAYRLNASPQQPRHMSDVSLPPLRVLVVLYVRILLCQVFAIVQYTIKIMS